LALWVGIVDAIANGQVEFRLKFAFPISDLGDYFHHRHGHWWVQII